MVAPLGLNFSPGGSDSVCTEVTITGGDGLEDEEVFNLLLQSPDPSRIIIGSPEIASITVINIDS